MKDGNNKTIWWIMSLIGILVSGGALAWMNNVHAHLNATEVELKHSNTMHAVKGEKIAALEANFKQIDSRLARMENKLDVITRKVSD